MNENIPNISNFQANCRLKSYFQKVHKQIGGNRLIHGTRRHKDNELLSLGHSSKIS